MRTINLRDYYPSYTSDYFVDVPDEIVTLLHDFAKREAAYRLRTYRHKAHYSLDRGDGIENDILRVPLSPIEIYERKATVKLLHTAIAFLPDKQAKRVYAHYFLGMTKAEIARAEGVNKSQVSRTIRRALKSIEIYMKNNS